MSFTLYACFRRSALMALLTAVLLFPPDTPAQSTAALQGTVTDPAGAAIANAAVTIHNEGTGEERAITTDQVGLYLAPSLPVGRYRVTVRAPGLQTTTVSDLVLEVGRTVQQNFTLPVATAAAEVQVVAESAILSIWVC
jgi:hypothetical protein